MSKYSEKVERRREAAESAIAAVEKMENPALVPAPRVRVRFATPQEQSEHDRALAAAQIAKAEAAALPRLVEARADLKSALALVEIAMGGISFAMPRLRGQHKGDGVSISCMVEAVHSKLHAALARADGLVKGMGGD